MSSFRQTLPPPPAEYPEVNISKRDYPLRNLIAGIALFALFLLLFPSLWVFGSDEEPLEARMLISLADALCAAAFLWAYFLYRSKVEATKQVRFFSLAGVIPAWVTLSGRLKPLYELRTPLTHHRCLYYRVERYVKRLRLVPDDDGWDDVGYKLEPKSVLKSRKESTAPFLLDDSEGSLLIAPHGLHFEEGLLNCITTKDADEPGWFGSRMIGKPAVEYREYFLTADQTVWVTGNAEAFEDAPVKSHGQSKMENPHMMLQRPGMADLPFMLSGEKPDLVTTTERREAIMYILGALAAAALTVLCHFPMNP